MTKDIESTLRQLADQGVESIEYFHCDHFEPWRYGVAIDRVDEVLQYLEWSDELWYAKRMSLFYKPNISYLYFGDEKTSDILAVPGEKIGFRISSDTAIETAAHCMRKVAASQHEVQVHIHHEGFTLGDVTHDKKVRQWLDKFGTEDGDEARLDIAIKLHLKAIRLETGLPIEKWGFVHGNWALNGSDHQICRIKNEISILMANGCYGDFTFPAGRRHTNPTILETPYTCVPNKRDKGYDFPEAKPFPVSNPRARDVDRFFIWHSMNIHPHSCIDYVSKGVRQMFIDPDAVVVEWLRRSPIFDNGIYIKTDAHSMYKHYWDELHKPVPPLQWPAVQLAFGHLRDACEKLGIKFNLVTVNELHDRLMTGDVPVEIPCLLAQEQEGIVPKRPFILKTGAPVEAKIVNRSEDEIVALARKAGISNGGKELKPLAVEVVDLLGESKGVALVSNLWAQNVDPVDRAFAVEISHKIFTRFGSRSSSYRLGYAYFKGTGAERDLEKARKYFFGKCLDDYSPALFFRGAILIEQDDADGSKKRGMDMLKQASEEGDRRAIDWLSADDHGEKTP